MTDRMVLIPLAGIGTLALDSETYRAALAEGARLGSSSFKAASDVAEQLLDADELAALLHIPATWIEQKAREGAIPSLEFGRWRRFRRSEVEAAVRGT